jgi:flagellar biosynthesis/type III secretory pathway M-ring protein FliF/YscJ
MKTFQKEMRRYVLLFLFVFVSLAIVFFFQYWYYRILTLQKHFGSSLTAGAKSLAAALDKVKKVENVKDSKNIADLQLRQAIINYERSTTPIKRQTLAKLKSLIGANLETTQQVNIRFFFF